MSFGALNVYVQTPATDDTTCCKNKSVLAGLQTGFLIHTCALANKQPSITDSCRLLWAGLETFLSADGGDWVKKKNNNRKKVRKQR